MTITTITKKVTITRPDGCSISLSIFQLFIDGVLQSSPAEILPPRKEESHDVYAM